MRARAGAAAVAVAGLVLKLLVAWVLFAPPGEGVQ